MIEVGIFDGGALDLPIKMTESGVRVPDANLDEVHEAAKRLQVAQVRRGVLADKVGFDYYWLTEHHFGTEGAELSTNPLQTQMAMAALTKRIRLGQLANIVAFHHPLRLAEQIAILDIISGGRTEVGLGRGYQGREAETFGYSLGSTVQDQERNRSFHQEAHDIILKAWTEGSFSHRGEFFQVPPTWTKWNHRQTLAQFAEEGFGATVEDAFRVGPPDAYSMGPPISASTTTLKQLSVLPQPLQDPHPPLWEPLNSERTIRWAAREAMNGNFIFESQLALKPKIDIYMEEAAAAGWPDYKDRGEFKYGWDSTKHRGLSSGRIVHITDPALGNADKKLAAESALFQWDFFQPFGFAAILANPGEPVDINMKITPEVLYNHGVLLHGSKQEIIDKLMGLKEYAYGDSDFITNIWFESGGLGNEAVEEQIQFFGEEILPVLRNECGGGPEFEDSGVDLDAEPRELGVAAG